jgi:hypothetical protein
MAAKPLVRFLGEGNSRDAPPTRLAAFDRGEVWVNPMTRSVDLWVVID